MTRPLRVLEAITPSRIGGAEVLTASFSGWLRDRGDQVHIFCPRGRPFVEYLSTRFIEPVTWKTYGKLDPLTIVKLAGLARGLQADVIHTHLSTASLLGALAGRLARIPTVAHVHGMNSAACYKSSTYVIAVSEAVKRHLTSQGVPELRVSVVHNGIDLSAFTPIDKAVAKSGAGYGPDELLVGVFGRLSPEKGQHVALEVFAQLIEKYPGTKLLIVGDGKQREALEAQVRELGAAADVIFTGFQNDVKSLMSACDVVVVPSLREGFGLAAVEAMALGIPVAASKTGGLPEIVQDGVTGILVDTGSPRSLLAAMGKLLSDPGLRQAMGEAGRARAIENFDREKQFRLLREKLVEVAGL